MIIIKLGGSLAKSEALADCLNKIDNNYRGRAVVIVPGGGDFADQVRRAQNRWQFDDVTAHSMALLAMQQMALMFQGIKPHFIIADSVTAINNRSSRQSTLIWSPDKLELERAGIKAGWEVTSDSLAAWLANALSANELILVKSAIIDARQNLAELAEQDIIDKAFCDFVSRSTYKITIINKQDF